MLPRAEAVWISSLHGSVWRGTAVSLNGAVLRWETEWPETLRTGRLAGDWSLDQPGSSLSGAFRLGSTLELTEVNGRVTTQSVRAVLPDLPADCDGVLDLSKSRLSLGSENLEVEGEVIASSVVCTGKAVPDLRLTAVVEAEANPIEIVSMADNVPFAAGEVFPDGRLLIELETSAVELLSSAAPGQTVSFEVELRPIG